MKLDLARQVPWTDIFHTLAKMDVTRLRSEAVYGTATVVSLAAGDALPQKWITVGDYGRESLPTRRRVRYRQSFRFFQVFCDITDFHAFQLFQAQCDDKRIEMSRFLELQIHVSF